MTPLPSSPTSVRLVCVRHGEAHHNTFMDNYAGVYDTPEDDPACPVDPKLTDLGEVRRSEERTEELKATMLVTRTAQAVDFSTIRAPLPMTAIFINPNPNPIHSSLCSSQSQARSLIPTTTEMGAASLLPSFVYVSPLRRATQTGLIAFPSLTFKFQCTHLLAEESNGLCCDFAQHSSTLRPDFGERVEYDDYDVSVDLESEHNTPVRTLVESKGSLCGRTDEFLELVRSGVEGNKGRRIFGVCSHSQWLQAFFVNTLNIKEKEEAVKWFGTGELRVVDVELRPEKIT